MSVNIATDGEWEDKTGAHVSTANLCKLLMMLLARSPCASVLDSVDFVQGFDRISDELLRHGVVCLDPLAALLSQFDATDEGRLSVLLRAEEGLSMNHVPMRVVPELSELSPVRRTQLRLHCRVSGAEMKESLGLNSAK